MAGGGGGLLSGGWIAFGVCIEDGIAVYASEAWSCSQVSGRGVGALICSGRVQDGIGSLFSGLGAGDGINGSRREMVSIAGRCIRMGSDVFVWVLRLCVSPSTLGMRWYQVPQKAV